MKGQITIEFDEAEDPCLLQTVMRARNFKFALDDFREKLRGMIKYAPDESSYCVSTVEKVRGVFYEILEERGVNYD